MIDEYFSTWNLIRVSGFLSYFLLTISLTFGFLQSFSSLRGRKADFLLLHQTSGWLGLLVTLFHMMMLFFDHYVHYPIISIIVPFISKNEPLLSGLGTISFYFFLIIIGSSDFFMRKLGKKVWKRLHILPIPAWIIMVIHGGLIGTDSSEIWAQVIFKGSISIIMVLATAKAMESILASQNKGTRKKTQ